MTASIFIHHVIGDLTVGKPDVLEFLITDTVEAAIKAIGECAEGAITVWRKDEGGLSRSDRFVGMLNSLDVVGFIAKNGEEAMKREVGDVVKVDKDLLKEVDPGTRLIDALDLMKQGVRRLLVRKGMTWRGVSKRFSVLYNGKWLENTSSNNNRSTNPIIPPTRIPSNGYKYCCLSREDIIRFLISRLGALAPLPLSSISSLNAINPHYSFIHSSSPAIRAIDDIPQNPCAVAVVETNPGGSHKLVGEISAYKLWKCDYPAAAWAMENLTARQFVMGSDDNDGSGMDDNVHIFSIGGAEEAEASSTRPKKFSSRSIGFFSNAVVGQMGNGSRGLRPARSMYRGRSVPLTCRSSSSLAAVMAQLLSHRATHVWVVECDGEDEDDDMLVGVVSLTDIIWAVTKDPFAP